MTLKEWLSNGILTEEKTTPDEISDLLKTIMREFAEIESTGLSLDSIFRFAYNAARQCAKLALRASGYRVQGKNGAHFWVLQSLRLTMGTDVETIENLEKFRRKRNIVEYEAAEVISQTEADEMLAMAKLLFKTLISWLKENHPELLQDID